MAIVKRVQLGSAVRRVQPPSPGYDNEPAGLVYEHIYHELIFVKAGSPDQGLPPDIAGLPEVGVPGFPDQGLPDAPGLPNNDLPRPGYGWPGCSGGNVDNSLPSAPPGIWGGGMPPGVWGGAPSYPDQGLPGDPPSVWGGAPNTPDNTLPPEAAPKPV